MSASVSPTGWALPAAHGLNHPPALTLTGAPTPMQRALALAQQGLWLTSPNPRVGCVITAPDSRILGEGHTQRAGGPHAEIMALRDAAARGHAVAPGSRSSPVPTTAAPAPAARPWRMPASPAWWPP